METLADWLAHAERLHAKNIDLGLDRVRRVAARMGLKFDCPVITVAGTNGKGSTCAMLESILTHAGYRTAVYTSPSRSKPPNCCRTSPQSKRRGKKSASHTSNSPRWR
jgi:folylpolyglutamate synthase/dihydropteroate synthase